ncbi:MAG: hypothetical protein LBQ22_03080 [Bacteroidales bacterium]|jgi:hypothetical protein|nr:hypothetical protein [Bacteroidales bacterium]
MDQENLFLDFLVLTQMYFREEKDIEFYAGRLDTTPDSLKTAIGGISGKEFEDWMDILEKHMP